MSHIRTAPLALLVLALGGPAHGQAAHLHGPVAMAATPPNSLPREGGQAAFSALGEIADQLQAGPTTDWSRVSLDALRAHLIDMDNVALHAAVTSTPIPGGMRFAVTGETEAVRGAIRRILASHGAMGGAGPERHLTVTPTASGADLSVTADGAAAQAQIRGLGFFGLLTGGGDHHQRHHLMMARGEMTP